MKNRSLAERALLKALVLAVTLGVAAHAGLGYLPLVGPPPLRFLASATPPAVGGQPSLSADTNLTTTLAAVEAEKWLATNTVVPPGQTNSTADGVLVGLGVDKGGSVDPLGASIFGLASPDLLNITPQMLAAYFNPVVRGTNTANEVVVPMPVIFTPPQTRSGPSSRAEYIVK